MTKSQQYRDCLARNQIYPLIQTQQLSLSYGDKLAFADITMSIPLSSITALVGPSGCGKSSFLTCLNRLSDLLFVLARSANSHANVADVPWKQPRNNGR